MYFLFPYILFFIVIILVYFITTWEGEMVKRQMIIFPSFLCLLLYPLLLSELYFFFLVSSSLSPVYTNLHPHPFVVPLLAVLLAAVFCRSRSWLMCHVLSSLLEHKPDCRDRFDVGLGGHFPSRCSFIVPAPITSSYILSIATIWEKDIGVGTVCQSNRKERQTGFIIREIHSISYTVYIFFSSNVTYPIPSQYFSSLCYTLCCYCGSHTFHLSVIVPLKNTYTLYSVFSCTSLSHILSLSSASLPWVISPSCSRCSHSFD